MVMVTALQESVEMEGLVAEAALLAVTVEATAGRMVRMEKKHRMQLIRDLGKGRQHALLVNLRECFVLAEEAEVGEVQTDQALTVKADKAAPKVGAMDRAAAQV